MSSVDDILDDYLDDYDVDLDDYDDGIFDLSDYDFDDYYTSTYEYTPTTTESSGSYPTSSNYDYDDYLGVSGDDDDDDEDIFSSTDFDLDDLDNLPSREDIYSGDLPSDFGSYGGIGADYSSQKTSNTCVTEFAFKTTGPKVDLAFNVIFLVLFVALAGISGFRLLKSKNMGTAIAKWFLFPASLFFAILHLFINFITLILSQCLIMRYDKYQQAMTATRWFDTLAVFLLIVLVLLPICLKLQQGGRKLATLTLIVNGAWLALTGIFLIVSLAVYSRIQDAIYRTRDDDLDLDMIKSSRGVGMAYYVFLFLAALLGGANMFFALFQKANIRKGTLLLAVPALILSMLVLTLILMGGYADREYRSKNRSPSYFERSSDAQDFLTRLLYAIAFLSALFIAASHQVIDDGTAQSQPQPHPVPPMAQPVIGQYLQPVPVAPPQSQASAPVPAPVPAPAFSPAFAPAFAPVTQQQEQQQPPVGAPAPYGPAHVA
ncbi:uncharacterized protein BDV17DRAFT_101761 [Aspergillus undulatus]|uniref:uncharacterized protein n=1 Tax=Aspergillus undulatus TaxID=1810928 RepID=UPI003CCE2889